MDARAHPLSAAAGERLTGRAIPASGADELIALLDEANVEKAMMASLGFHARAAPDDAASSAENDFTAEEVAKFPDRLIGFCGINPLYSGALEEIDRCLGLDGMVGMYFHLRRSGVDLTNVDHVTALFAVFAKAEEHDAPVQLHTQPPPMDPSATANLAAIITAHPDVRVLHSHCGGFIDDNTRQLWLGSMRPNADTSFLDLSECLLQFEDAPISKRELIVWMLREWGIERVLWSSDNFTIRDPNSPLTPLGALTTLSKYPFTQEEMDLIRNNDASAWLEGPVAFTSSSDVNRKENFRPVDGGETLEKIRDLTLESWNYKGHDPQQFRHYGPTAQEFFAAFGDDGFGTVGTETTINSGDMAGILMIAVQALEKRTADLDSQQAEIATLKGLVESQQQQIAALRSTVASLSANFPD